MLYTVYGTADDGSVYAARADREETMVFDDGNEIEKG